MDEEQRKNQSPPAGGADGPGKYQCGEAFDGLENKPEGAENQSVVVQVSGCAVSAAVGSVAAPNGHDPAGAEWRAANPAAPDWARPFSLEDPGARFLRESSSLMSWRFAHRWTIWKWESGKGNKPTKAPYQGRQPNWHASNNDSRTWSTFAEALAAAPFGGGLNFSFGGGSSRFGFVGLDLDECRNPNTGEITPWARKLVDEYGAYTEISVSGTGLHILGRKDGIEPFIKLVKMEGGGKLEIFCQANHFLCLTGNIFEGHGAVPGNLDALLAIHKPKSPPKRDPNRLRQPHGECPAWVLSAIYETPEGKRSEKFYNIVAHLKRNDWDLDDIEELFEQHLGEGPLLVKYEKRLRKEIERVFDKVPEGEELDLSWASLEDARSAPQPEPEAKTTNEGAEAGAEGGFEWPDPRRIGDGLLPVRAGLYTGSNSILVSRCRRPDAMPD